MNMAAYYNEFDPKAAAWLRELIKQGHIADGVVDERSIEDVTPTELAGFTQCHFFAGIGVWSYALRQAGWSDDRPVWTGSCPCQPFSAAGKGAGFSDERHLWPAFHHLISQCRPDVVFGEQVASKDGLGWLDLVQADLEATGYASGAVDLCAAGVGAPHIRQRLWWVGTRLVHADGAGSQGQRQPGDIHAPTEWPIAGRYSGAASLDVGMANTDSDGRGAGDRIRPDGQEHDAEYGGGKVGLADTNSIGAERWAGDNTEAARIQAEQREPEDHSDVSERGSTDHGGWGDVGSDGIPTDTARPCPTNGHWRDADWLFCRDGKWRPVEPGTSPLAHGSAARVGRLRGYGNAIVAQAAQAFIESVM